MTYGFAPSAEPASAGAGHGDRSVRAPRTGAVHEAEGPVHAGRRAGDGRAASVLAEYAARYGAPGLPIPIDSIAVDLLGLRVRCVEGLGVSGLLVPGRREICLSAEEAADSEARRRFTLAYEVAHWVLHHRGRCARSHRTPGSLDPREREANVFAAELLMPTDAVRSVAASGPVRSAARRFGVSTVAMGWRLYDLGLADRPPEDAAPGG